MQVFHDFPWKESSSTASSLWNSGWDFPSEAENKSKQSLLELLFMFYSLFGAFAAIDYYVCTRFP